MACVINALKDMVGMLNIITASNVTMRSALNVMVLTQVNVSLAKLIGICPLKMEFASHVRKDNFHQSDLLLRLNVWVTLEHFMLISLFFLIGCEDKNCYACSGPGPNTCTSCMPNTYMDSNTKVCTECEEGYSSDKGATSCTSKF